MTTLVNGLLGGLLVGLVAAVVVALVEDGPSVTTVMLEGFNSVESSAKWWSLGLWTTYGAVAGVTLVALELYVLGVLGVPPATVEALSIAVTWSTFLLGVLAAAVRRSLPSHRYHLRELLLFHLVFGVGLGIWIRMTWIT